MTDTDRSKKDEVKNKSLLSSIDLEYVAFKVSGKCLSLFYTVNDYIPITSFFTFITSPIENCKKSRVNKEKHDNIHITNVLYNHLSPLKKDKKDNVTMKNINTLNIKHSWKIYEQEHNEKPKIGDILEVHYTVPYQEKNTDTYNHKSFVVPYVYPSNIVFPPYTLKNIKDIEETNKYKNGILDATYGDNDITEEITKLAGPMGNFYSDLPCRYGIQIPRTILLSNDKKDLIVTDNNAEEYVFKSNSILRL